MMTNEEIARRLSACKGAAEQRRQAAFQAGKQAGAKWAAESASHAALAGFAAEAAQRAKAGHRDPVTNLYGVTGKSVIFHVTFPELAKASDDERRAAYEGFVSGVAEVWHSVKSAIG